MGRGMLRWMRDDAPPAPPVTDDEQATIRKAQAGDRRAFDRLVSAHLSQVWATVYRMLRHREDTEDVVQEVFVTAHRALKDFRGDSKLSTWLHRIAVSRALNHLDRAEARVRRVSGPIDDAPHLGSDRRRAGAGRLPRGSRPAPRARGQGAHEPPGGVLREAPGGVPRRARPPRRAGEDLRGDRRDRGHRARDGSLAAGAGARIAQGLHRGEGRMSGSAGEHPRDLLSAYVDGELIAAERAEVEAHLAACAQCRDHLLSLRALSSALRDEPLPPVSEGLEDRIGRRLDEATVVPFRRLFAIPATIAATIAAIGLVSVVVFEQRQRPEPAVLAPAAPPPASRQPTLQNQDLRVYENKDNKKRDDDSRPSQRQKSELETAAKLKTVPAPPPPPTAERDELAKRPSPEAGVPGGV